MCMFIFKYNPGFTLNHDMKRESALHSDSYHNNLDKNKISIYSCSFSPVNGMMKCSKACSRETHFFVIGEIYLCIYRMSRRPMWLELWNIVLLWRNHTATGLEVIRFLPKWKMWGSMDRRATRYVQRGYVFI